MNTFIYTNQKSKINETSFEVVETKGMGHPDNICDALAEKISAAYSNYCLDNFGTILRHMVDKITILGGGSRVEFGKGEMTSPIRILLNGRFTDTYEDTQIDYLNIVDKVVKEYFNELFPLLDIDKWVKIIDNTHLNEGPGVVYTEGKTKNVRANFFKVHETGAAKEHSNRLKTNDTSTTVGYYPLSDLEEIVLKIESSLNSTETKRMHPYLGNDIKVMGIRKNKNIEITSCVPFIANYTPSTDFYNKKLGIIKDNIIKSIEKEFQHYDLTVFLNTRDNPLNDDYYLTAIGSAVESGDEGAVGRGNRANGVISFTRPMSIEAPCGKNPVYHTGKIYTAIAREISKEVYDMTTFENAVYMTSKMGGDITEPWSVAVELNTNTEISTSLRSEIDEIVNNKLQSHYDITIKIISNEIKLNNY